MHSARSARGPWGLCGGALATVVFLPFIATTPAISQQQSQAKPTYRVEVNLVQVDVFVTDAKGQFVPSLAKEDFELLEDGKLQPLSTFALVNLPVTADPSSTPAAGRAPAVAVRSDVETNAGAPEPRVYVLMLDDLQTSPVDSTRVREAAVRFIDAYLEPGDVAAVMQSSGRGDVSVAFTSDRARLRKSAGAFVGNGLAAARSTTERMRAISDYLAGIPGRRKACVYFGPGFSTGRRPIPLGPPTIGQATPGALGTGAGAGGVEDPNLGILEEVQYRDLVAAANRANVSYYTMDVRGIRTLANLVSADTRGVAGGDEAGAKTTNAGQARDQLDTLQDGRLSLPADTGGVAALNSNVDRFFRQVQVESSSYYVLGYNTAPTERATLHKIVVRSRRPGITVRARREFWWPGTSARPSSSALEVSNVPPALLPALQYPLPNGAIRMTAAAAAFRGKADNQQWASVVMELDGRDLDSSGRGALDVAVVSVNAGADVRGSDVRRVALDFNPDARAGMGTTGLRIQARVPIPREPCSIRIAVADVASGRVGSFWFDLDVPDLWASVLSMSGVAISYARAGLTPTANADQELRAWMPGPVSTRREFTPGDTVAWSVEVYPPAQSRADLVLTTTIAGQDGSIVLGREQPLTRNGSNAIRVTDVASLKSFPPGRYVLRINAHTASRVQAVSRQVPFRVAPASAPGAAK